MAIALSSSPSSFILCRKHPDKLVRRLTDKWLRTISSHNRSITTTCSSRRLVTMTNRKRNEGGERISVWWRDGWRLISCADFGGGAQDKRQKPFFSSYNSQQQVMMGSENNKEQEERERAPKLLTIPTILTLARVAAIPLLVTTFYSNSWWATTVTTSIFVAAAITDWLDGYLARKMRLGTPFGAFLDPVADKLMVAATLVLLCTRPLEFGGFGEIPWLLPIPAIAIIGREITMSAVREWAASQNGKVLEAVAVNNLGKWKTASQMIALTILLATRDSSLVGSQILVPSGVTLLYISAGLAIWSLAVYMKKIWRVLLKL